MKFEEHKLITSITIVFNTKSIEEKQRITDFTLENMSHGKSDEILRQHIQGGIVCGPLIPPGMNPEEHPDKNKVFVLAETDNVSTVQERLAELLDIDFEIVID